MNIILYSVLTSKINQSEEKISEEEDGGEGGEEGEGGGEGEEKGEEGGKKQNKTETQTPQLVVHKYGNCAPDNNVAVIWSY